MRRVLIAPENGHAEVQEFLPELTRALGKRSIEAVVVDGIAPDKALSQSSVEMIVVLGGDGFLMQSIRAHDYPTTPFYGVNYGQVGFLMNPRMGAEELAALIAERRYTAVGYPLLDADLALAGGGGQQARAFNDFVLERASGQTVHLLTYIDDVLLNRYSGDGLIVATPGGSSAYSLAAGGPLVHDAVEGMIVTPLYPHRPVQFHSLQFPILLPLRSRIRVTVEDAKKRPARFVIDGRAVENVVAAEIAHRGVRVNLLRDQSYNFIEALVRKIIGRGVPPPAEEE